MFDVDDIELTYCKLNETCCKLRDEENSDDIEEESNEIPESETHRCGERQYFELEGRVGNGEKAQFGEWLLWFLEKR